MSFVDDLNAYVAKQVVADVTAGVIVVEQRDVIDVRGLMDLDPMATEITDPLEAYAQDMIHRLIEMPGTNPDDPDRGLGLTQMLSGPIDRSIEGRVVSELSKDSRTDEVTAKLSAGDGDGVYLLDVLCTADGALVPFVLELSKNGVRRVS